jgi:rhamnulose-1-phosphate aldolase
MIGPLDNLLNITTDLFQKKELKPVFAEISETAKILWERGWAERNAGNFSINITAYFHEKELDRLSTYPFNPMPKSHPELARKLILVSGTGTRMRDVFKNPQANVCFVYISDTGSAYHIISDTADKSTVRPTSELATHLAIQQLLLQKKADEKVVLHAHVTELIALTQIPEYKTEDAINRLLWGMHPETVLFLPGGIGFIPFTVPGSEKIATATIAGFQKHKVILWEKHGGMSVGKSIAEAFDHLDILAKSAKIFFLCKSAGLEPEGLTQSQVLDIRSTISANDSQILYNKKQLKTNDE